MAFAPDGQALATGSEKAVALVSKSDGYYNNPEIKIPLPPADIAKQLKGGCKKIPYRFTWSNGGKVR